MIHAVGHKRLMLILVVLEKSIWGMEAQVMITTKTARIVALALAMITLRPPQTLAIQTGFLYAGTSNPGKVYLYKGGKSWEPISEPLGYAVLDIIEFKGQLYAGTMSVSDPQDGSGSVWRYDQGTEWSLIDGDLDNQVCDLIVWNGDLYAGTAWRGGKMYRLNTGEDDFDLVGYVDGWSGIRAMYVWKPQCIQLGDIWWDKFGRYDGADCLHDSFQSGSCIYDFAPHAGALYAAAFAGRLFRSTDGINWSVVLDYTGDNIWELEPFQGYLYLAYNDGLLARIKSSNRRTFVWTAPDSIISMLADGDNVLYFGTGGEAGALYDSSTSGEGYVYAYTGSGTPELISDYLGTGVQCLYWSSIGLQLATLPATDIGTTDATLWARIVKNEDGCSLKHRFCYWADGDMWVSSTPWTDSNPADEFFSQIVTGLAPGATYRFWAEAKSSSEQTDGWDSGLKTFETLADPIELKSPNGRECLLAGSKYIINWLAERDVNNVVLEYSLDSGRSWRQFRSIPNTERYRQCDWTVPQIDSQQCLVCISDASDPNVNDVSDELFYITTHTVPDLRGMSKAEAKEAIASAGLILGTSTYRHTTGMSAGRVISQQPAKNTPVPAGSVVDIIVSIGRDATAKPQVKTEPATDIGRDHATLCGRITNDGGGLCQYRFCYWRQGQMWITNTSWNGYAGQNETFSHNMTDLEPEAQYWYWAEAKNTKGRSTGWASGLRGFTTGN